MEMDNTIEPSIKLDDEDYNSRPSDYLSEKYCCFIKATAVMRQSLEEF